MLTKTNYKNILVLDTETAGEISNPMIYDFGYKIVSPSGEELAKFNAVVSEIFDTKSLMVNSFYAKKIPAYRQKIASGDLPMMSWKKIYKQFIKDIRKHKVGVIAAYNLAFDVGAINATMRVCDFEKFENFHFSKLVGEKNKKLLCIWNLACETIFQEDAYHELAETKEWKTAAGNVHTNAEVAYRFIKENHDFIEEHTALSDVEIEIEILQHILKNYKGEITFGLHYKSWSKAQR